MTSISPAFVAAFESEVHLQYLMMGSKLRNTVRTKSSISDCNTSFDQVGVPNPMSATCSLQDYYAGDWVDDFSSVRLNSAEQQIIAKAGAYALGRKSDELIVNALMDASCTTSGCDLCHDTIARVHRKMHSMHVPDDGQRFAIVGWKQWSELLGIDEFAVADYLSSDELPWKGTQAKRWLNTIWIPHSGLPKTGNVRSCFWYHRTAVGHAIGDRVTTDFSWHGNEAAFFVNNRMEQGACLIDPSRVVRMQCVEK